QILYNLVGNAVKFTEQGEITVRIEADREGDESVRLRMEVKDSGMGIASEDLESIFQAFTQQKGQAHKFGGSGLGLAITKRLVEALGGDVSVDSRKGEGSRFTVFLPGVKVVSWCKKSEESDSTLESSLDTEVGETKEGSSGEEFGAEVQHAFSGETNDGEALLQWLETEAYPYWDRIYHTLFVDEWRHFASMLKEKGEEFGSLDLLWYSAQIDKYIERLSISNLRRTSYRFPELLMLYRRRYGD
ncbi:MAG TPA: ATP-binding protein, partial [Sediminispirochaeta sp.]|nr:ATP-binding protein [Sediminispirochaeta sp.]